MSFIKHIELLRKANLVEENEKSEININNVCCIYVHYDDRLRL